MKHDKKNIVALVVAAGSGQRAKTSIPKQYVTVKHKAIIDYTVSALCNSKHIDAVLCVIAPNMHDLYAQSVTPHSKLLPAIFGGANRQESVRAGLLALHNINPDIVFIHDAARPNIDNNLMDKLLNGLSDNDGVCPALPVTDSLRKADGSTVPREGLFMVQTPQIFNFQKILDAHNHCYQHNHSELTDDIAIANVYGLKTCFIQGTEKNYKLTYPNDFEKFENELTMQNTLRNFPDIRTAMGYDVHCLIAGDGVILGGIKIDCPFKLQGHSDADVVLHAITDAILGAIAAQDIGYHFNPNDNRWKGADSAVFLRHAQALLQAKGGVINFIDTTIICETPKISPHRDAIRGNIADILTLPIERVSVKATTTEKLGFTGRSEGIATQAIVTVVMC